MEIEVEEISGAQRLNALREKGEGGSWAWFPGAGAQWWQDRWGQVSEGREPVTVIHAE